MKLQHTPINFHHVVSCEFSVNRLSDVALEVFEPAARKRVPSRRSLGFHRVGGNNSLFQLIEFFRAIDTR